MKPILIAIAAFTSLVATMSDCRADIVTNGSFETASPGFSIPTGNGEALATGSTAIAGWTVIGGHVGDGLAWLPNGDGYAVSTPYGNLFLDLTGYHDSAPYFGVAQTLTTTPGQSYALGFSLGVDQGSALDHGPISVLATAGSASGVFTANPSGTGNLWTSYSLDFTATSATTTISFQGVSGDEYIGLDNVSANLTSAPVPEPASFGMLALGLALVGCVKTRKATRA